MLSKIFFSAFVSLCLIDPAFATEVDNYTNRNIPDATQWLNLKMNQTLKEAGDATTSCEISNLHKQLYSRMGGGLWSKIEKWGAESPLKASIPVSESIFADIKNTLSRGMPFRMYYSSMNVRIGDVIVGDDKLGHFFQSSYEMYLAYYMKRNAQLKDVRGYIEHLSDYFAGASKFFETGNLSPEELVLNYSLFQEEGHWGNLAGGVFSYGDIAANFDGFRFWQQVADGSNPYFSCENGKWKQLRQFKWSEYVSAAWDEAINCNTYYPQFGAYIEKRIASKYPQGCPIQPQVCVALRNQYGTHSEKVLHPKCFNAN